MKVILIIQARVNSKRLYGKSIIPIYKKKSSLQLIIEKFKKIKEIDDIYIATGPKFKNAEIYNQTKKYKVNIFFGSENNVRERFVLILKKKKSRFCYSGNSG